VKRFWPIPLWLELAAGVLLALLITNFATWFLFRLAWSGTAESHWREVLVERAAAVASVLIPETGERRARLLQALTTPGQELAFEAAPLISGGEERDEGLETMLKALDPVLVKKDVRVAEVKRHRHGRRSFATRLHGPHRAAMIAVSVEVEPRLWLNGEFGVPVQLHPAWPFALSAAIAIMMLLAALFWMARRVVNPLQRLEQAALSLKPGQAADPVVETGPRAVRAAIKAFNAMSGRLMSLIENQRVMMAAVAHDLRSPITSLRLRAEFVSDAETKERMLETLSEMEAMTDAVLDLSRAEAGGEPRRLTDLAALAESVCDDFSDTGAACTFTGGTGVRAVVSSTAIKRALRNLIENALRYGTTAHVSMAVEQGRAFIHVDDEGPGIPKDQLEAVFAPFLRLEGSRNQATGGYGLGLTIARMIARAQGGDATLENRSSGGLRATLRLPAAA
jgi:signal transduction histidine kinase